MDTYVKPGSAEQSLRWAWVWFAQLACFHHHDKGERNWQFSANEVVGFLRSKRDADQRSDSITN